MNAAAERDDDEPDLTPEERAKLRALLKLIERGARSELDRPTVAKVRPERESPPAHEPALTSDERAMVRAKVVKAMKRRGEI